MRVHDSNAEPPPRYLRARPEVQVPGRDSRPAVTGRSPKTADHSPMSPAPSGILTVAQPFCRDLDSSIARVERAIECARAKNAGLVVFPECALGGYIREPLPGEAAPDLPPALDPDGPEIRRLIQIAGEMVVCIGYTEVGAHGPYSAAVCVSGDGVLGPPPQGSPAAGRAVRLHRRRPLPGVRHPRRPARDAALLRQALPGGGDRARGRRRADDRLHGGVAGRPAPARGADRRRPPDAPLRPDRPGAGDREPGRLGVGERRPAHGARCASSGGRRSSIPTASCSRRPVREPGWRSPQVDRGGGDRIGHARRSTTWPTAGPPLTVRGLTLACQPRLLQAPESG